MASPSPARPAAAHPVEHLEDRARRSDAGTPGPWSRTATSTRPGPVAADTSTGRPSGRVAERRCRPGWPAPAPSAPGRRRPAGRSAGRSTVDPRRRPAIAAHASTTSDTGTMARRSSRAPDWMRVMSSRLATSRSRVSDWVSMSSSSSSRSAVAEGGGRSPQGGDRRLDRGQGGPQVVGDGAHQRVAPPVDLLEQLGTQQPVRGAGCARGPGRPGWRRCAGAPSRGASSGAPAMANRPTGAPGR